MKRKIIVGLIGLMFVATSVFAMDGHDHDEHKGSMMEEKGSMKGHHEESEQESEVIEVGNKICPVSGEKVASMGGDFKYEYKGKIYNLCCKMCLKDFKKNPEKYSKIADQSVAKEQEENEGSHSESGEIHEEVEEPQEDDSHSDHQH